MTNSNPERGNFLRLLRRPFGIVRTILRRTLIWRDVARLLEGVTDSDQAILRRAIANAPRDVWRELDQWRDPTVSQDCSVTAAGIGTFRVRANSDDLYHALPTRERAVIGTIRDLLRPGDCFVDAGANIGVYSVLASRLVGLTGQVIAIEMMPDTAAILRGHLTDNGCDNATLVEAALSDVRGQTVSAHVREGKFGQASIATGVGGRVVRVGTITLADILSSVERVQLIKMDLEGAELGALKGTQPVLERIDAILFEDWGRSEISNYLTERGYAVERLDRKNSLARRR